MQLTGSMFGVLLMDKLSREVPPDGPHSLGCSSPYLSFLCYQCSQSGARAQQLALSDCMFFSEQ